jgi:hypothetical protein
MNGDKILFASTVDKPVIAPPRVDRNLNVEIIVSADGVDNTHHVHIVLPLNKTAGLVIRGAHRVVGIAKMIRATAKRTL